MENQIDKRLRLLLENEGLTSSQFAKIVGYRPSSISHILSGRNKPGFDFIQEILKKFDTINPEWLILGHGEMYKTVDKVIENSKKSASKESINTRKVESEHDPLPYVSDVKIKTDGKVIVKVLVFYSDQTFTEYVPSEELRAKG
ncbi:MAG: helix-turn-helix transcriptional regulator [Bacteroidales bacterium]|nr:helix-turn-helix transcriptional regulator [Bacteroidales bacterium]